MSWACSKRVKPSINSTNEPAMNSPRFWLVIPAAGVGARMQADRPKQYLQLAGRCIIEHSLECFLEHPGLLGAVVCLAPNDPYWPTLACAHDARIQRVDGGAERADSVLQGLLQLTQMGASEDDWVLVHDAARPCLPRRDLENLIRETGDDSIGGILALPVADTVKRAAKDEGGVQRVAGTEDRAQLWLAQTPQMFRIGALIAALENAGDGVTDESSAIEAMGLSPKLVPGSAQNFKVTYPEDFALAEAILQSRAARNFGSLAK